MSATERSSGRLRVLLVTEPGLDGAYRHVEQLARYLVARGHEVDLAYSSRRGGPALTGLVEELRARGAATLDLRVGNWPEAADAMALVRLQQLVRRRRPDVIHAHSSKAGALVRLLPTTCGARLFYTPHAYFGLRPGAHWQGRFYNRLERLLGARGTTINVSESEAGFAATVLRVPLSRRVTVANGVDLDRFRPPTAAERVEARARAGVPAAGLVLGCVARLSFQKDPETLYRGLALARADGLDVHLLHVGHGQPSKTLRCLVEEGLRAHVTHHAMLDPRLAYHASDGLIATSRYEGMSLVVLEALACGLPLLLSNVPGNDDILRRAPSQAFGFPPGDAAGVAAAMRTWAGEVRAGRANNHRDLACRLFDQAIGHRAIESIYRAGADAARVSPEVPEASPA